MRISIICYYHFDATIPLGKYLIQMNEGIEVDFIFLLSKSRLSSEILDLSKEDLRVGFVDDNLVPKIIDKEILEYLSTKIKVKIFLFNSSQLKDVKNIPLLFQLKKFILEKNYDVLHFVGNSRWIIFLNYFIKRMPKVHTIHEPYPFIKMSKYRLYRRKRLVNLLIHSNSHLIVPSQKSYERFVTHFKTGHKKCHIIPFGIFEIYKEYSKKNILREPYTILFYGNISKYKGVDVLIKAMRRVSKLNSKIKLIIAGAGSFDYDLKDLDDTVNVINRHLSNQEIAELNQLASLVVCPYISASQSGVVMTSFAFGNPIVATKVGALPEMIEDGSTGILVEPENDEMLSDTFLKFFREPREICTFRENIQRKYADSINKWPHITELTYQLYRKVLEDHN